MDHDSGSRERDHEDSNSNIAAFAEALNRYTSFEIPADTNPYEPMELCLQIDSLQVAELVITVEGMVGCNDPPASVPHLVTLADAFAYYHELAARPSTSW